MMLTLILIDIDIDNYIKAGMNIDINKKNQSTKVGKAVDLVSWVGQRRLSPPGPTPLTFLPRTTRTLQRGQAARNVTDLHINFRP
jgi:hypothetical protein